MLLIRPDQLVALSADIMERRILGFLRQQFPARMARLDPQAVSALIQRALAPASGMTTEQEIVRYVIVGIVTYPDFETNAATAWARPVLRDAARRGEERVGRLFALARRHGFTVQAAQEDGDVSGRAAAE
jgi:hypothetical protein